MKIKSIQSNNVSFNAYNLHIIDGGVHADNMEHFAKAAAKKINKEVAIKMHYIDTNKIEPHTKQMKDLEDELKSLRGYLKKGDYLAITGLAPVALLNLQDRLKYVLHEHITLTPQNIKTHKVTILKLLKEFYDYKNYYSAQIAYMDKNNQDLEYVWGVIQEINNLVDDGVNVYIPSGHGIDAAVKWKARNSGLNDYLYRYIATGKDTYGNDIRNLINQVKSDNWYDFNLLALSNAHIVNVKKDNTNDALFKAFDTCVNDGEKGVYNFYPVRDRANRILGYSYNDRYNVEYPYNEFPANRQIDNLNHFVGLPLRDFYADRTESERFKQFARQHKDTSYLPDKLYQITNVFDESTIRENKLDILGKFIDRTQRLIFDTNSQGEIIYQKTNCEGSERPSVMQMWGSCFSSINAIFRDICRNAEAAVNKNSVNRYITLGNMDRVSGYYSGAEHYYNLALDYMHPDKNKLTNDSKIIETYENLYEVLKFTKKTNAAKGIANILIDLKSYTISYYPAYSSTYKKVEEEIAKLYSDMASFCEAESEYYPARVCRWASKELEKFSHCGNKIISRRAEHNQYIGDLYDEYS